MTAVVIHCTFILDNDNKILKEIGLFNIHTCTKKVYKISSPIKVLNAVTGIKYIDLAYILDKCTRKYKFIYALNSEMCNEIVNILKNNNKCVFNLEMFKIPKISELLTAREIEQNCCYTILNKIGNWCHKNNYKINLMNNEARLETFNNFSHKFIKKNQLSEAGFIQLNYNNESVIKCIYCDVIISTWCLNDVGFNLHKKYNTKCILFNNCEFNDI
jgi:hypothetical protein